MTINCAFCEYYFVTHEAGRPWGCKRFGFKSSILPNYAVKNETGIECAYFKLKKVRKSDRKMSNYGTKAK